jgi:hypothetical protein
MPQSELNFLPCSELLGAGETPTRPYEVPVSELFELEELVRPTLLCTVPLYVDELPDDAYPTEVLLVEEALDAVVGDEPF